VVPPDRDGYPCQPCPAGGEWLYVEPLVETSPAPPWDDDRAWIARWRDAGPTLAERKPVLEAWLAAAPLPPLPRRLAAVELARIARNQGIAVEVGP
jgi:hypothetical protein